MSSSDQTTDSSSAPFDFIAYLKTLWPDRDYTIQFLGSGSGCTVRARDVADPTATLILKHTPSYVAAGESDGPDFLERQKIEVASLTLLRSNVSLGHIAKESHVAIPQLIKYDTEAAISLFEDLGPMFTLWQCLTPSHASNLLRGPSEDPFQTTACDLGRRIGAFFGQMHCQRNLKAALEQLLGFYLAKTNPSGYNATLKGSVEPLRDRLAEYTTVSADIADKLSARVRSNFFRPLTKDQPAFTIGNLHPGSILVASAWREGFENCFRPGQVFRGVGNFTPSNSDEESFKDGEGGVQPHEHDQQSLQPTTQPEQEDCNISEYSESDSDESMTTRQEPKLAVINWEFARIDGNGVNGDLAQLLACLHCYLFVLQNRSGSQDVWQATRLFMRGICEEYGTEAELFVSPEWRNLDVDQATENYHKLRLLRSTLIIHGREMISMAFEQPWRETGMVANEEVVAQMVKTGAWYIDVAKDTVDQMVEPRNWNRINREEHQNIIRHLFSL